MIPGAKRGAAIMAPDLRPTGGRFGSRAGRGTPRNGDSGADSTAASRSLPISRPDSTREPKPPSGPRRAASDAARGGGLPASGAPRQATDARRQHPRARRERAPQAPRHRAPPGLSSRAGDRRAKAGVLGFDDVGAAWLGSALSGPEPGDDRGRQGPFAGRKRALPRVGR